MNKITLFFLFIFHLFISLGCSNQFGGKVREGMIDYAITYYDVQSESIMAKLLPKEMTLVFQKGISKSTFWGPVGIYNFSYISNSKDNKNSVLFYLNNSKYFYQEELQDIPLGYNEMGKIKLDYTEEKKIIQGFNCKKVILTFEGEKNSAICYVTNDIICKTPNISNLFNKIEGTLLEFEFIFINPGKLRMKFTLNAVQAKKIEDSEFEITSDYEKVSRKSMQDLLSTNML